MVFSSNLFLFAFLPLFLAAYYLTPWRFKSALILLFSYAFYAWWRADFLVLMTGRSDRQVASLAQSIEEALRKKGVRATSVEGLPHASWVLMDFGDVVVHVFQEDSRNLYDLEGLWMDARRLPVPLPVAPS